MGSDLMKELESHGIFWNDCHDSRNINWTLSDNNREFVLDKAQEILTPMMENETWESEFDYKPLLMLAESVALVHPQRCGPAMRMLATASMNSFFRDGVQHGSVQCRLFRTVSVGSHKEVLRGIFEHIDGQTALPSAEDFSEWMFKGPRALCDLINKIVEVIRNSQDEEEKAEHTLNMYACLAELDEMIRSLLLLRWRHVNDLPEGYGNLLISLSDMLSYFLLDAYQSMDGPPSKSMAIRMFTCIALLSHLQSIEGGLDSELENYINKSLEVESPRYGLFARYLSLVFLEKEWESWEVNRMNATTQSTRNGRQDYVSLFSNLEFDDGKVLDHEIPRDLYFLW